ncbi:MAG TPA: methionyl-tRNA formyltransferase, partial [Mycobacteriales bacterium]|nr:methionyl-tRNA formyltransferase [Mycobacteriales bacterium]
TPLDARVDWSAPALRVDRLVRACTPVPGAWTTFRGKRLKVLPVNIDESTRTDAAAGLSPGELYADADVVLVGTGSVPVRLGDVQPEGRAAMAAAAWSRGVRLDAGDVLE